MPLDRALKRLSLEPSSVCRQCRRTFASSARTQQQESATGAFANLIQSARTQTLTPPRSRQQPPSSQPSEQSPSPARSAFDPATSVIKSVTASAQRAAAIQQSTELSRGYSRKELEGQQIRKWKVGDVYAPHDLSGTEQGKWKRVKQMARPRWDVLDQLNIRPMEHYKNFSIMSEYVTEMGRMKHSRDTGLRPRNQRKMAKAVRRAIGLGLIPSTYRHPEILKTEGEYRRRMARG